jgi:hypothetical protein
MLLKWFNSSSEKLGYQFSLLFIYSLQALDCRFIEKLIILNIWCIRVAIFRRFSVRKYERNIIELNHRKELDYFLRKLLLNFTRSCSTITVHSNSKKIARLNHWNLISYRTQSNQFSTKTALFASTIWTINYQLQIKQEKQSHCNMYR